jgi:hypothetical protein
MYDSETGKLTRAPLLYLHWRGERVPIPCRKPGCPPCHVKVKAREAVSALRVSRPTFAVGLTALPDKWKTIQRHLYRFLRRVRSHLDGFQLAHVIEHNPLCTGCHLHGFAHFPGDRRFSQSALEAIVSEAAVGAGLGVKVWVERVRPEVSASYYAYPLKELADPDKFDGFIQANGRRAIHATKNFWRDGITGTPLGAMSNAVVLSRTPERRAA